MSVILRFVPRGKCCCNSQPCFWRSHRGLAGPWSPKTPSRARRVRALSTRRPSWRERRAPRRRVVLVRRDVQRPNVAAVSPAQVEFLPFPRSSSSIARVRHGREANESSCYRPRDFVCNDNFGRIVLFGFCSSAWNDEGNYCHLWQRRKGKVSARHLLQSRDVVGPGRSLLFSRQLQEVSG